jgi:aerobic-type carbon monoxide dehydrogenase small subunit (CoxS/CutS family)
MSGGRIEGLQRGPEVEFTFEGRPVRAHAGESVAMALWAQGCADLRGSSRDGAPRGVLCNMGICFECVLHVDGVPLRACMTEVRPGMRVERGGKA